MKRTTDCPDWTTCGNDGWHTAHLTRRYRVWMTLRYGIWHRLGLLP